MTPEDCMENIENQEGSDALTLILTIFLILVAIISAELNKY